MLTGEKLGEAISLAIEKKGVSKKAIAERFGVKPPSVQDWIKRGTISKDKLFDLIDYFSDVCGNDHWGLSGNSVYKISPVQIAGTLQEPSPQAYGNITTSTQSIKIPLLNVTASMGNGSDVLLDELALETISIHQQWADRVLRPYSNTKNLAFIHAIGDSMSPTFSDGDILLVDTWDNSVTADKIYVIEAHERLFIKRVRQRIDGAFEISSDNPAVKTVDVLNGDHQLKVKGRVVWVWNGKKI